jgi:hypothetical protein
MKKKLLLLSVILGSQASFGQLTQANEPAAGTSSVMHVVDTGSVTLASIAAISGTNVEWNYTGTVISLNNTQAVTVADASGSTDFPSSTKSISQGQIVQYFNSTSTERVSQGFVFNEPTFGQVVAKFTTNEAILLTYPFDYGSALSDTYAGTAVADLGNIPLTGKIYSTIDGTGTLKLPGDDYPNVFRLTTIDTTTATFLAIDIEVIRTQYEYYDLADQNLPIFIDATITIGGDSERQVLSKHYSEVGLDKNAIQNLVLYPNPSNGEFTISGEFVKGNVEVTDLAGRVVYTSEIISGATVKLNDVKSGVYTVKLSAGDKSSIQKITIK